MKLILSFNPASVRFKRGHRRHQGNRNRSFNPASVRFKPVRRASLRRSSSVSILPQCDSNTCFTRSTSARNGVSILPQCDSNGSSGLLIPRLRAKFQSCLSAIQTVAHYSTKKELKCCFNPASVRFKPHPRTLSQRRYNRFNPASVRFKHSPFFRLGLGFQLFQSCLSAIQTACLLPCSDLLKWVSILPQCDSNVRGRNQPEALVVGFNPASVRFKP